MRSEYVVAITVLIALGIALWVILTPNRQENFIENPSFKVNHLAWRGDSNEAWERACAYSTKSSRRRRGLEEGG